MKKIITAVSLLLILAMIPMALFACNSGSSDTNDQSNENTTPTNPTGTNPTEGTTKPTTQPTTQTTATTTPTTQSTTKKEPEHVFEWSDSDLIMESLFFEYEEHAELVKHLGRTQWIDGVGIGVDMVASGIEFKGAFIGEVTLDLQCTAKKDNEAYLAVFVDGVRVPDTYFGTKRETGKFHVTSSDGVKTLTIANFSEAGEHTIRIVKQTESNYALLDFIKLTYTGILDIPPADKDFYIEFIGDSLTCGMGSAGDTTIKGGGSAQGINGADWEDGTFGYAYRTAQMLDADYSIVSESGIGLAHTWFSAKMGEFYTRTSYNRSTTNMYSFERTPDLVVINLGTNDHYLKSTDGHSQHYTDANIVGKEAKALMETIRSKYGSDVKILWVSGVWTGIEYEEAQVNSAIAELGGEAAGIYSFKLTYNAENVKGAEGHPSKAGHDGIMSQVYAYISDKGLA